MGKKKVSSWYFTIFEQLFLPVIVSYHRHPSQPHLTLYFFIYIIMVTKKMNTCEQQGSRSSGSLASSLLFRISFDINPN
ncbi:MAG: hypothetical protein BWX76_00037 [Candidatus Cloacimonetes bacterium ADurb.Bin089]|jgi:hypothetical protein|nr:MAG: hypothetical protein BWX76_00037 [Candidatus Cloacimonetes bacterium ADurb.Bin089]